MRRTRAKISEADRRFVIGQSGGRCNKCRREVFVENELGEKARLGDDAHIVAFSNIGPRGTSSKSDPDRACAQNLILLCKTCHSEVDQQPKGYSVDRLLQMREDHYSWIESSLGAGPVQRPRFHYLSYINVPRADMYAVVNSIAKPTVSFGNATSIRDLGFQAGRFMASYTDVLNHEELYANELTDDTKIDEIRIGSYWFSGPSLFRSKKIRDQSDPTSAWKRLECVIYKNFGEWKLFWLIDPRWITTNTAYATLSGGILKVMGLVHIKQVDLRNQIAIASPLFLGAPDNGILK
ncbi:hypothetical protein EN751_12435 [Mesorhizobium sp. M4A.F.Ca.ET.029.04.2.1]|nr:hypothetical protein EN751_12435 [Mesorhizobium sp. M4A.F.Ca.ET.029.04.2.1]